MARIESETEINIGRYGSRNENIVAPPVIPETMAMNGTMQQSRAANTDSTANANEFLKAITEK